MFLSSDSKKILETIKKEKVAFVDLRFTDTQGLFHHFTLNASAFNETIIQNGLVFDGSSLNGWQPIDDSDLLLVPDLSHTFMDPFSEDATLVVFCTIKDPVHQTPYIFDPRSTALKAEEHLKNSGIADTAYFGPEPEFFVFDDIKFNTSPLKSFYHITASERAPACSDCSSIDMNHGHRPQHKGGYLPLPPIDSGHEIRSEMLKYLERVGVKTEKHHHEVASNQHELGFEFSTLVRTADNLQLLKYVVHNVATFHGKTATFMPKPLFNDNGNGMHIHQSLWHKNAPLFSGEQYANLSDFALYYIGGILHHAPALNAFTNPTTNSYKRLVPGYEAPVIRSYSARNRSAAIRIPHVTSDKARRIEIRFPDPAANPYLALAATLMAGLDGIKRKISPSSPKEKNWYEEDISHDKENYLATSLKEALDALENDHAFLTEGDVFHKKQIDSYITLKRQEIKVVEQTPHPQEFSLYYSL